jgi:hypothetical protein
MPLNILLLCNKPLVGNDANTILDHIQAFEELSKHNIFICSNMGYFPRKLDLNKFDAIIIHYSLCLLNDIYISRKSKKALCGYNGLKLVFVQDEYRKINQMLDELQFIKIDVLFTCFPETDKDQIYSKNKLPHVSTYSNLTGYIPERLTKFVNQPLIKDRPIDVGYRGRKLPFWYGALAVDKWAIVDLWFEKVQNGVLNVDLSYEEKDRIYGPNWNKFLSSCKTTLGVESGTSVMDFTGELEQRIEAHQLQRPNDSFSLIQKQYLLEHEGRYKLNQISPRCFEAIALKTALVLFEGEYSGVLVPDVHYIVLKKDFSNIDYVISLIKNTDFLQSMVDKTFNEIALNPKYSYKSFIESVDKIIDTEFCMRQKQVVDQPYSFAEFDSIIALSNFKNKLIKALFLYYQRLPSKLRMFIKLVLRPKQSFNSIRFKVKI